MNVPKLRFPGFDGEWQVKKLGDLFEIGSGRDYKHLKRGSVPVYGTGGLMLYVDDYLYDGESVGIGRKGTIDKPQWLEGKFWTVDTLFYTKNYKNSNPKFVYAIFQKINWQKHNEASGVPSLSKTTIEKIKVTAPCVDEQEKIGKFLTAVDERITLQDKKVGLLKQYKKGMMQKIFTQKLRFKDENDQGYPAWKEKKLGKLCETAKSGGTPTATNRSYYEGGKIPFLAISDMTGQGKYLTETSKFITESGLRDSASWIVPKSSLIYSMYASVGFVSINKIALATSQAVINLIPNKETDVEYLYYFLSYYKSKIHRLIETGTQGNLNAQTVKSIIINLPSVPEQRKMTDFLIAIDDKIRTEELKLEQAILFKKSLLQRMFV